MKIRPDRSRFCDSAKVIAGGLDERSETQRYFRVAASDTARNLVIKVLRCDWRMSGPSFREESYRPWPWSSRSRRSDDKRPHVQTMKALAEFVAAAGLSHPVEFTPEHFSRRISANEVLSLADSYPPLARGGLLAGTQDRRFKDAWAHEIIPAPSALLANRLPFTKRSCPRKPLRRRRLRRGQNHVRAKAIAGAFRPGESREWRQLSPTTSLRRAG